MNNNLINIGKKTIAAVASVAMLSVGTMPVFAETAATVSVNGDNLDFGTSEPVIIDGTTYVPIRTVFEHFGKNTVVDWGSEEKTVTITYKGEKLVLYTLTGEVSYKGENTKLSNIPVIIDGRTLLPLRELVEMLGGSVTWFADTKSIEVYENLGNISGEAEPLAELANVPLPRALYMISENRDKYKETGFDEICDIADTTGYEELATAAKAVAKIDANEMYDSDKNLPVYGKFAEEYFNAIIGLDDKSFLTGAAKIVFTNPNIVIDKNLDNKTSIANIYNASDSSDSKVTVSPETAALGYIICSDIYGRNSSYITSFAEAMMHVYDEYIEVGHKDWDKYFKQLKADYDKEQRDIAKSKVEEMDGVPLPEALYRFMSTDDFYIENLPAIINKADCNGYDKLKEYALKAYNIITEKESYGDDDEAVVDYFYFLSYESLNKIEDKSILSEDFQKIFDNPDFESSSHDITTKDSVDSLADYLAGKTDKVRVNSYYEILAKSLVYLLKDEDAYYGSEESEMAAWYSVVMLNACEEFSKDLKKAGVDADFSNIPSSLDDEFKSFFKENTDDDIEEAVKA